MNPVRPLSLLAVAALVALTPIGGLGIPSAPDGPDLPDEERAAASAVTLSNVRAVPLGTGKRALFIWDSDVAGSSHVQWGLSATSLSFESGYGLRGSFDRPVPAFVTQHSVFVNNLLVGLTYYYRVGAAPQDDPTTVTWSPVASFVAQNGPTAWDGQVYTINLWMKGDLNWATSDFNTWSNALRTFALLVEDMTDGYVRIGTVVLEDSDVFEPNGFEMCGGLPPCLTPADIVVPQLAPYDSHTMLGGIETNQAIVVGRNGQLVTPWTGAVHRGFVLAHEFGHYAFWLDDQYALAGGVACVNVTYDVSIMHNSNVRTEMDHSGTPCAWRTANGNKNSWDDYFRPHYPQVPTRALPDVGPCNNGSCSGNPATSFQVVVRDR